MNEIKKIIENNKLPCFSPKDSQNSAIYVISFTTELGNMIAWIRSKISLIWPFFRATISR